MNFRTMGIALGWLIAMSVQADVKMDVEKGTKGYDNYIIENEYYRLVICAEVGGWGISFKMPKDGKEWVYTSPEGIVQGGGLFKHNFTGRGYKSDPYPLAPREVGIVTNTPEKVVLSLLYKNDKEPVTILQEMTFEKASPVIKVKLLLTNISNGSFYRGLWPKFDLYAGGDKEDNWYFRPDTHGVYACGWDAETKQNKGEAYVKDPYAGWSALVNAKTGVGMVFLMDYNYLQYLYDCLPCWTVEWFYEDVPIMKDGKWETVYHVIPVKGYKTVAHASENLVASHAVKASELESMLGASVNKLKEVVVTVSYATLKEPAKEVPVGEIKAGTLTDEPQTFKTPLPSLGQELSVVFTMILKGKTAEGKAVEEKYQYVHNDKDAYQFDLMQSKYIPVYERKRPKQVRVYPKPTVEYNRKPGCPMLELRGVGYHKTKVQQAATMADIFDIKGSWFNYSWNGPTTDYFPTSYEELFGFNLVVMNDINAFCIQDFGREMLKEWVKAGGGLLVFGGPYSLSNGRYQETQLADVLPVSLSGEPFSFKKIAGNATLEKDKKSRILKDVAIPRMDCYYMEYVTAKTNASVELTVDGRPFLVCGEYGRGRVAVIAGSVFGEGKRAFYENERWPSILSVVINWLNSDGRIRSDE